MTQRSALALAFLLCMCAACSPSQEGASGSDQDPTDSTASGTPSDTSVLGPSEVFGEWTVIAHYAPGISAMSPTEADAWVGRTAFFDSTSVSFADDSCDDPSFSVESLEADAFGYDLESALSDMEVDPPHVSIIDILCDGSDWVAPGSWLLVVSETQALTQWDGVYFELSQ